MSVLHNVIISAAVEGNVDEAVARSLIHFAGAIPGRIYGKNGKQALKRKISGFNKAAQFNPWIVLIDLDHDADCPPPLCQMWVNRPSPFLCFRIAVREIETWLLSDRENASKFLKVNARIIPKDLEKIDYPKEFMVNLARQSRSSAIRQDMVPRPGGGRSVGPAYSSRLIEFVTSSVNLWRPGVAIRHSDSLGRSINCLRRIMQLWRDHQKRAMM